MRLGLIGPGRHGSRYLMPKNGGEHIVAILSRSGKPQDHPALHTTDPEEFFAQKLDGVIVATPTETHARLVVKALAMGCAVLCEKPLCTKLNEAELMVDTAEMLGLKLGVAHTDLFHENWTPQQKTALRVVASFGGPGEASEWAPHALATAIAAANYAAPIAQRTMRGEFCGAEHWAMTTMCASVHALAQNDNARVRAVGVRYMDGDMFRFDGTAPSDPTPIRNMLDVFMSGADRRFSYDFTRAVYRVLLTEP